MVAVVGPTATGKTALGVALAQQFSGEVISADSMQIYKGLDVGTAKVTPQETCGIPHHGVDILTPEKTFSVADFTALAGEYIQDITARGHLPLLVGGTGLYVQSLLYGVRFTAEKAPDGLREQLTAELEANGPEAMYAKLQAVDPEAAAAIHPNNKVEKSSFVMFGSCFGSRNFSRLWFRRDFGGKYRYCFHITNSRRFQYGVC